MIRPLAVIAVWFAAALPLPAQDDSSGRDRSLEEMEAKLQEQRALAVRSRLLLYLDELEKLQAQISSDTAGSDAVKAEIEAVQFDVRQLTNISRRQAVPPAPDEVKKDEQLSATALAARRINKIIERFNAAKAPARPPVGAAAKRP